MSKKTSNLLQALERVKDNKLEDFIAPLPEGTIDLLSVQNGIPYWFQITNETPGWYRLKPRTYKNGVYAKSRGSTGEYYVDEVGEPQPYEIEDYLNQLPHFNVIALYPVSQGSWLCVPHSVGDTKQRGWDGKPKVFTLCSENIEPLDVVRVANLAGALIYHEVSKLVQESWASKLLLESDAYVHGKYLGEKISEIKNEDWRKAFALVLDRMNSIRAKAKEKNLEEQLRYHLDFVGAKLVSYQEVLGEQLEVTYEFEGMTWTLPKVDKNLRIQSAGICLSGTDRQHNLSSIVEVMHEARKLRRADLNSSYYL